jgi:hypothetical protein
LVYRFQVVQPAPACQYSRCGVDNFDHLSFHLSAVQIVDGALIAASFTTTIEPVLASLPHTRSSIATRLPHVSRAVLSKPIAAEAKLLAESCPICRSRKISLSLKKRRYFAFSENAER